MNSDKRSLSQDNLYGDDAQQSTNQATIESDSATPIASEPEEMIEFKFKLMTGTVKTCLISKSQKLIQNVGFIKSKAFSGPEYHQADIKFVRQGKLLRNEDMLKDLGKLFAAFSFVIMSSKIINITFI